MKKFVLSMTLMVGFAAAVNAQTTLKPHVGFNITDVSVTGGEASGKAGFLAGLSVAFGKKIYFEPGLQYVQKATEIIDLTNPPTTWDPETTLSGFRVPVAVGINLLGSEKTTFSLRGFGGASAFFITNTSDNIDDDNINKTNFGVFAGAGLDIWKLFVDLSYEWSLTNLQEDVSNVEVGKTRSLFVNAGFRFNF
ncbi:MAG TPA: outer membrane beta-barrel protein [Chitinophagaceae bacterium]|nr:outer membrane beta-barrel protein [Chitinophagaceae bacterium]